MVRTAADGVHQLCLVHDGRHWGLPKGNVERGETPEQTALREIAEETGLPFDRLELIAALPASEYVYRRDGRLIFKRVHFFLVSAPDGVELVPQPGELDDARWLSVEEARRRASFPDTVRAIDAAERLLREPHGAPA